MKKYVLMALLLTMVIVISTACSNEEETDGKTDDSILETEDVISESKTEDTIDKDGEVKIDLPQGWEKVEGSVLKHQYMKDTASLIIKEETMLNGNIDEIIEEAKETFESTFDDVTFIEDTKTMLIDSNEARNISFTCKVANIDMKYYIVYTTVNGKTYGITIGDMADSYSENMGDISNIINNIKFQ